MRFIGGCDFKGSASRVPVGGLNSHVGQGMIMRPASPVDRSFRHGAKVLPRLQPKPKDRREVPIPVELRESLCEVFELIRKAKNDPDIVLDYDDAIQTGAVSGGRYGKDARPYVLTYYPEGDP